MRTRARSFTRAAMRLAARSALLAAPCVVPCFAPRAARAQGASGPAAWTLVAEEAERAARRGDHARAREGAERLLAAVARLAGQPRTAGLRLAEGRAWLLLAAGNPQAVRNALAAFDAAAAMDSAATEPQLRLGALWLAAYNAAEARTAYQRALAHAPAEAPALAPARAEALLGLARVAAFDGKDDPAALARLQLDAESVDSAQATAARAVAAAGARDDGDALEAWSVQGAIAWLVGDSATLRSARAGAGAAIRPQARLAARAAPIP